VNDAIKLYVRQRLTRRPKPAVAAPLPSLPLTPTGQFAAPIPMSTRQAPSLPLLPAELRRPLPPPRPPPLQTPARGPMPTPPYVHRAPPPLPRRILVTYGDQTRTVEGATFVSGRAKASGLAIKDPNISRHAMIELHGGVHYLVDAGSTNGTFVNGERIARRALADGDVVTICDHVIRISVAQCR